MVDMLAMSDDKAAGQILLRRWPTSLRPTCVHKILAALKANLTGKWSYLAQGKELNQTITKLAGQSANTVRWPGPRRVWQQG